MTQSGHLAVREHKLRLRRVFQQRALAEGAEGKAAWRISIEGGPQSNPRARRVCSSLPDRFYDEEDWTGADLFAVLIGIHGSPLMSAGAA